MREVCSVAWYTRWDFFQACEIIARVGRVETLLSFLVVTAHRNCTISEYGKYSLDVLVYRAWITDRVFGPCNEQ